MFNYLLTGLLAMNLLQAKAQCSASGSHYTASYPTGWTEVDQGNVGGGESNTCADNHNGSIYISGTAAYFISARDGRELRASKPISTLDNVSWTMDFTLIINPSYYSSALLATNSPSVILASLTAANQSLKTSCSTPTGSSFCTPCSSYSNTNMDAMWVSLTSDAPGDCNQSQTTKNWRIVASARDGNGTPNNSTPISISSGVAGTYYIRLQRTNEGKAVVSVFSNSNFTGHLTGSPQCLGIPGTVTDLHVLSHEVQTEGSCYRTFNGIVDHLKIDNTITCPLALNPSFTMPASVCQDASFTVNGSASTSGTSMPIGSHMWVVEECDVNGNQFGPVWYSPAINTAPSLNYTINPSTVSTGGGPYMVCNHYYKVSLVLMNCGNRWAATSKILTIKCRPYVDLTGSPTWTYAGNPINLVATVTGGSGGNCYVLICETDYDPNGSNCLWNSLVPPGTPVLFPTSLNASTTYYPMAYDVNGCSGGGYPWEIDVSAFRAEFTANPTVVSPTQFTLETTPVDLNGNDFEDFTYTHIIEELDQDGNSYYANTSPDCWNNYPDFENFKGFTSTGTGTYDQASDPECGDPGRFLIGHRYRVTTIMEALNIDPVQYSVIIYLEKSGQLVVEEDKKAPDMTRLFAKATLEVTIFPNPSNGIYTIELEEGTDGSQIKVTNTLGQTVKTFSHTGLRSELNMTGFAKGIYTVTITSNGISTIKKIILE